MVDAVDDMPVVWEQQCSWQIIRHSQGRQGQDKGNLLARHRSKDVGEILRLLFFSAFFLPVIGLVIRDLCSCHRGCGSVKIDSLCIERLKLGQAPPQDLQVD